MSNFSVKDLCTGFAKLSGGEFNGFCWLSFDFGGLDCLELFDISLHSFYGYLLRSFFASFDFPVFADKRCYNIVFNGSS